MSPDTFFCVNIYMKGLCALLLNFSHKKGGYMKTENDPLVEYQKLRKRIINNDELSDDEWDLFFELEEKSRSF